MNHAIQHRTKIVATIGPACDSEPVLRQMLLAGTNVARLNFSHGTYTEHAHVVTLLRTIASDLDRPITLLQDLQGPKIRAAGLPQDGIDLVVGESITLVPLASYDDQPHTIGLDYPHLATEAVPGTTVLLDDGQLELTVERITGASVHCQIATGGHLQLRKGVNVPSLNLQLPSLTPKDERDLEFGISQGIDWVSLSFVRSARDVLALKTRLANLGAPDLPTIAKIEKPQAIANLDDILAVCDGVMVARGDLGVEMRPEKVPLLQKQIVRACNKLGIPAITATQMLESMMYQPRPTRAEASDVANAILDGTDAVMLSGESAVGHYPVEAVSMLARIAADVETNLQFTNYPAPVNDVTHALSEALNAIDRVLPLRCIVTFTSTGYTARLAAAERPSVPVVAFTPNPKEYHRLNLVWGVIPMLLEHPKANIEDLIAQMEACLIQRQLAIAGDTILVLAGSPIQQPCGTNLLKIHTLPA